VINEEKRQFRETVDAEISNVIYMELYSGAKMADGKYQKTYVARLIDRENTVLCSPLLSCAVLRRFVESLVLDKFR
jgi:hypothetical protein